MVALLVLCLALCPTTIPCRPCRPATPCDIGHTIYIPRSPHCNNAYWVSRPSPYRIRPYTPRHCNENTCDTHACDTRTCEESIINDGMDFGVSYQSSFLPDDLARCIFGATSWTFAGSAAVNRPVGALLADQFGLSPTYLGTVQFTPTIKNTNLHAQGCWNFYTSPRGHQFFTRMLVTMTHQQRSLYEHECAGNAFVTEVMGADFPPGAMSAPAAPTAPSLQTALNGTWITGDQRIPWCGARLTEESLSATAIAGVTLDVGYATPEYDVYRSALFLRYRAPTGTRINDTMKYRTSLWAPIVGDGAHHELGAGFTVQREFWRSGRDHTLLFRCDGYATHLFANQQRRTLDLCTQGPFSRYMLLKQINPQDNSSTGTIIPASCFTTRNVTSSVTASGEVTLQFMWHTPRTSLGIGYEFFGRTRETLRLCTPPAPRTYGVKGCTGAYGYTYSVDPMLRTIITPAIPFATPLNSTASASTIYTCGKVDPNGGTTSDTGSQVTVAWDNPWSTSAVPANAVPTGTDVINDIAIAYTSDPPTLLSDADLNLRSGVAPKQVVHKGFITISHMWPEHEREPYIIAGFSGEGSGEVCALKQWGIWVQTGLTW